jgi:hypothetical protein
VGILWNYEAGVYGGRRLVLAKLRPSGSHVSSPFGIYSIWVVVSSSPLNVASDPTLTSNHLTADMRKIVGCVRVSLLLSGLKILRLVGNCDTY